jgi:hypothetical protein
LQPICDGSPHWALWHEIENKLAAWTFIDMKGNKVTTPTVENIRRNIRCYRILWDILKNEGGYDEFFLGEINQDPLENAFGLFKFFASLYRTPTSFEIVNGMMHDCNNHLTHAFNVLTGMKTALLHNLSFEVGSEVIEGNCAADGSSLLVNMRSLFEPIKNQQVLSELQHLLEKYSLSDLDGNLILPHVSDAGKVQS